MQISGIEDDASDEELEMFETDRDWDHFILEYGKIRTGKLVRCQ